MNPSHCGGNADTKPASEMSWEVAWAIGLCGFVYRDDDVSCEPLQSPGGSCCNGR